MRWFLRERWLRFFRSLSNAKPDTPDPDIAKRLPQQAAAKCPRNRAHGRGGCRRAERRWLPRRRWVPTAFLVTTFKTAPHHLPGVPPLLITTTPSSSSARQKSQSFEKMLLLLYCSTRRTKRPSTENHRGNSLL